MKKGIELQSRAKINISLDVLEKRPDGYHELKMIMQTIDLQDHVRIEVIPGGIEVECSSRWVPSNQDNIAYKAASLVANKYNIKDGLRIVIDKRIPVAAGLAGGSSNAAAVLKGLNALFSLGLEDSELMRMGKQIGADVPYCIKGGTMLAEGIGEILTGLQPFDGVDIVLVKPKVGVSTAWVFRNLELDGITARPDTELLIRAIQNRQADVVGRNMRNVLESVTIPRYKIIRQIKDKLVRLGAAGSVMSGSGPSVFGIFPNRKAAEEAYCKMKNERWDCFITKTV